MNFRIWIETQSPQIDVSRYVDSLQKQVQNLLDYLEDEKERLRDFKLDTNFIQKTLISLNYPYAKRFMAAIASKNPKLIHHATWQASQWGRENKNWDKIYEVVRLTYDYTKHLEPQTSTQGEADQQCKELMQKTMQHMQGMLILTQSAVDRIEHWNESAIRIVAHEVDKDNYLEPQDVAEIHVGTDKFAPSFMCFIRDGKVEIDDIIEADETDFFQSQSIKSDYFNLIKEMQSPGSTKKGKTLALYTARPTKDRDFYSHTRTIPTNVYLTTKLDSAEGLARDLGGSEVRDVWKVRMNAKYLLQTLDMPQEKQYQVVGTNVPVEKMVLLIPGT